MSKGMRRVFLLSSHLCQSAINGCSCAASNTQWIECVGKRIKVYFGKRIPATHAHTFKHIDWYCICIHITHMWNITTDCREISSILLIPWNICAVDAGGCYPQKTDQPYSYSQIAKRNLVHFDYSKQTQRKKYKYSLIEQGICVGSSIFIERHERAVIYYTLYLYIKIRIVG